MPIRVTCGSCNTALRVADDRAGKRGQCPRCRAPIEVPLPSEPVSELKARPAGGAGQNAAMRDILEAFQGDIPRVRRTALYRVTALFVAAAILVLPILYLAIVAGIGYLLFLHATKSLESVVRMRSWVALVFLYVVPLIAGAILLFFMVKPLFARRSRSRPLRTLEFGQEPLLFALVTRVARAVGAPEPKRIDVDCQVNASAGFGSRLGILTGGDLVLTVGLPLAAGLSVQQLAGVIAHELGHFSQGAGMRLTYFVRAVNEWFGRVVYERDDWDEALVRGIESGDRLTVALYLAMLCVWLTRGVLWVLMVIGHVLSGFLLRQMEYDADRYEARLAGTAAFEETSRKLILLGIAANTAHALTARAWMRNGRLPDDFSALTSAVAGSIPPDEFRRIERDAQEAATGFFDTHPAHGDRLVSARREAAGGVFHLGGPATLLFKDFTALSRAVTVDFYREVIGKRVKQAALVPATSILTGG